MQLLQGDSLAFQSTPSAWRETDHGVTSARINTISIHSLRMEGDVCYVTNYSTADAISIHSLRMEGDPTRTGLMSVTENFNPLPPHGGRHHRSRDCGADVHFNPLPPHGGRRSEIVPYARPTLFQSTPSAWRETLRRQQHTKRLRNFNPLPPHGGRLYQSINRISAHYFNPLPPHGGRLKTPAVLPSVKRYFNPLPPHGGRRGNIPVDLRQLFCQFQSTPSAWRETLVNLCQQIGKL